MARFLSEERNEPPDIDVDFEHERREEVMQYVYNKYGRERAALAATVIRYRGTQRGARCGQGVRPAAGPDRRCCPAATAGAMAKRRWSNACARRGFDPENPLILRVLALTDSLARPPAAPVAARRRLRDFRTPLWNLVPVENAAMADRTIIQWDKDDLEAIGLLKVDCLALGMLTCLRKAFELVKHASRLRVDAGHDAARRPAHLRHDPARRHGRRVPDRIARADEHAAAAQAAIASTTWWSRWRSCGPARSRAAWCIPTCAGGMGKEKP